MLEGIQYPKHVNLTLRLGKAFDITYVRVKFVSPRPESFRIFKKAHAEEDWTPWQYYSGSCRSTYKLPEKAPILPGNEAVAQCTREFSDISPLTGGNIAFPTLEGRPSAENFEESEVLQTWVTATEIRITLDRMNTFGDEIFGDPRVLRSYYWAISDFAVGGRCKCNGHASQCVKSTGQTSNN
uniref:Laminin N-terminal domain-containing protein n=1 Tax=Ditylenchus dipsaci TaxID=166011 RepID=A0A915EAM4_9BILA